MDKRERREVSVLRSAKEAKESKLGSVTNLADTLQILREDQNAAAALVHFRKQGLDERKIAAYVFSYCGGTIQTIGQALRKVEWVAERLKECAEKVAKAAEYVEITMRICDRNNLPLIDEEQVFKLKQLADLLTNAASSRRDIVVRTRIGGNGKKAKITSGRTHTLLRFAYALQRSEIEQRIKSPTRRQQWNIEKHRKPSIGVYQKIAMLIAPILLRSEGGTLVSAEALRRAVDREADSEYQHQYAEAGEFQLTRGEFNQFVFDRGEEDYEDLRVPL